MITKEDVLGFYRNEIEITTKVLKAVPEEKLDFKPHERSNAMKDLFRGFIGLMMMNRDFLQGIEPKDPMSKVPEFDFAAEGVGTYITEANKFLEAAEAAPAEDYEKPFSMWGLNGTRGSLMLGLMCDMIHHRGQMSVYIRLAGGLVPSIYGPSADDKGGF